MKKIIVLAVSVGILAAPNFVNAQVSQIPLQTAEIPEVPPPTPVEPSTGTVTVPLPAEPTKPKVCRTISIQYVCGTEQKCSQVKIMDSYSTFHYETVCVDVEKYCTKTEEVCE